MTLKCYMADTGLLFSHAFSDKELTEEEIYKAILFDRLSLNEGMFLENIVAQMLRCRGDKLFFYSCSDRENKENRMEIDFLIREDNRISPVEVKSSAYNRHSSLNKLKAKFGKKIGDRYIIYTKDYKKENGIIYLPVYMVLCNRQSCRKYVVCNQSCRYNYYIIDYKNAAADEKLYTEDLNYDIRRTD